MDSDRVPGLREVGDALRPADELVEQGLGVDRRLARLSIRGGITTLVSRTFDNLASPMVLAPAPTGLGRGGPG